MVYKLNGEQPFQVLSSDFSISPSESGYELYFSADGFNYTSFATVGAGVTRQFTGMNAGNYYKLMGNTGEVSVNWERDCCGGGSGSGAGVSSLNGQTGALTTKTINGNDILGSGDITIEGGAAQYDLDAMTQAERAEFVTMCENLTDEERRLLFVYRDGVICTFDHTEGSEDSFKIMFFDTRNDGWSYTTTKYRHFSVKADGSYEELGYGVFPEIITYDTNYSDTTHALSSSDNFSPLNAISNLNAGQDGKVALNLRLIIQSNPAKIVLSSKAWSEKIGDLEGKIGAEWHYNGNVVTAVWNVVEHNATIESWTEVPEGGSSEISLEYNQIREIEHKDYVSYTFTHSGSTWGNYEAWMAQITNGENSFQYGIWQGNAGDMKTTFYASGYSNGINPQGLDFLRPIMLEAGFYEKFPEFYIKWNQEGSTDNLTWTFAVPSSYTVEILSLENYPGIEYVGSAITSFTEIAPASPIYLDEGYSANTFSAAVQRYIVRHHFEEEFSIYGDTYWVQREQNGDPGWIAASDLGIGDDKTNAYLTFYGRNGKYLINWIHDGTFLVFGKQSIYTIYNQNFESDLVYNSATDEFTSNGETLSADTAYDYFVNWGGLAEAHKGTVLADLAVMLNYKLPIVSGSTRWEVSHPSVMFEDVSVTIGETQFQKLITFDYGEWVMSFYINGNNKTANFKMYHRKKIENLSQSDYDALVQAGTVDANTLYVII